MVASARLIWQTAGMPDAVGVSEPREAELARRAKTRDREAIVELYQRHHARLRATARRLLGDDALAEDLVHETFMALPDALERYRGDAPLGAFLVGIAARKSGHLIRAARRRRGAYERMGTLPGVGVAKPDELAERRELALTLTRALDELPDDQRIAFVLTAVEERSSREVARLLDARDGTIRARVMLAKRKLRELLAAELDSDRSLPELLTEEGAS